MKVPKKPNGRRALPFYWWRRFKTHKYLPYKTSVIDKILNGDFEYSPFFDQANWELHWMEQEQKEFIDNYQGSDYTMDMLYLAIESRARKRYNRLFEDGMNDERSRMDSLIVNLGKHYKINKRKVKDFINVFEGTTVELFESLRYE